jgi:hypothetical protein
MSTPAKGRGFSPAIPIWGILSARWAGSSMAEQLTLNQLVGSSSLPRLTSTPSTKSPGSTPLAHDPVSRARGGVRPRRSYPHHEDVTFGTGRHRVVAGNCATSPPPGPRERSSAAPRWPPPWPRRSGPFLILMVSWRSGERRVVRRGRSMIGRCLAASGLPGTMADEHHERHRECNRERRRSKAPRFHTGAHCVSNRPARGSRSLRVIELAPGRPGGLL